MRRSYLLQALKPHRARVHLTLRNVKSLSQNPLYSKRTIKEGSRMSLHQKMSLSTMKKVKR
jgi:hypothetical protein